MPEERELGKVCHGKAVSRGKVSAATRFPMLATVQNHGSLSKPTATISIGGLQVKALFVSGSTESFIQPSLVEWADLAVQPAIEAVSMASTALSINVTGMCTTDLKYQGRK